ncbi:hypothetical protein K1719_024576 [Acacia pycnantha]|nr:hypothetical protein K1719_024576 [Acacia pycnantha]
MRVTLGQGRGKCGQSPRTLEQGPRRFGNHRGPLSKVLEGAAWAYDAGVSEKVAGPVRGACAVVLPEGIDGRSDPLCAWISQTCLPLRWNDPKVSGISIPIVGAHVQPPSISRLAVLDRRLPCFHLLAAQGARGVWMPRRRREGRNAWACEWCLIVPAGWLRARPPNGLQRSASAARGGMVPHRPVLVLPTPSGEEFRLDVSLHPAPSKGRGGQRSTPAFQRASSVAWPAGTCDALGPSERRGRGLTSRSQEKLRFKKLVVGPWAWLAGPPHGVHRPTRPFCRRCAPGLNWPGRASGAVTLKKLECSKQAYALDTLAWDNIIGFRSYCVGLLDRSND